MTGQKERYKRQWERFHRQLNVDRGSLPIVTYKKESPMTWREKMQRRLDSLLERVKTERNNLSDWRKDEAIHLALTPEENEELKELDFFLRTEENGQFKKGNVL